MKKLMLMAIAIVLAITPVSAKDKTKNRDKKQKGQPAAQQAPQPPKPSISRQGMFDITKVNADWFMEIPDSLLGKDILAITRYTSTPSNSGKFGGEMCNEQVVYFQKGVDGNLLLRSRMTVNVADTTQMINKAVVISNENPIIASFKIESSANKRCKIKVNAFLNDDNALGIHQSLKKTLELGAPMMGLGYIEDIKTFPTNTEIRLVKTYNSSSKRLPGAVATGKVTFGLNISFVMLPEQLMMPRYYDPRVGYFTESFNTFNDQQQRVDGKTLISRYRLEPKDSADMEKMRQGELVEPKKPIVYYIDPATPKQWRKYLIAGVNDWQKAFEKAGFKNAIRGEEWPENDSTMSMEDARFCVIRYLASPIANAYGPHVSDPRTGEILESHVCWYHNVMSLVHDWYMIQASSIDEASRKMKYDEELMGNLIRFVSSHEVGHSLGLRHNFGSSSTVPVDSLRNRAWVEKHGHTPSIMDYARFNYVAQPEDGITRNGIFPRIGDYDEWAIQWGYKPMLDARDVDEDHKALEPMVLEAMKNPRLWWGDGEGLSTDPRRQTEDLGDDAVKASTYGVRNLKREMANLESWTADEKDIYGENLGEMYYQFQAQLNRYVGHVAKYIGGTYQNYRTREQGGTVFQPTPLAKQKASLKWLEENIINEPVWIRSFNYCKSLAADTRDLTLNIARTTAYVLVSRIGANNDLYPAEKYIDDLVRMAFRETATGASVSKYREALQLQMVSTLITTFTALPATSISTQRAHAMYALKQIQSKVRTAAGDAHTRSHYANINDLIARALLVK